MTTAIDSAIAQAAAAEDHGASIERPVVQGRVLHVDGDYLAYFAAGNDDMPAGTARQVCCSRIDAMQRASGSERVLVHLTHASSDKGRRYAVATVRPYQGQRSGKSHPKNWAMLRDFLESADRFDRAVWYDREADDGFGHAVSQRPPVLNAFATRDKDMRMLPGIHLNWMTLDLTYVPEDGFSVVGNDGLQYGMLWFAQQMLMGDKADNIPGLEKYVNDKGVAKPVGEVTAVNLLGGCTDFDEAIGGVAELYADYYKESWGDRFIEQAALLWLRRTQVAPVTEVIDVLPDWLRSSLYDSGAASRLIERARCGTLEAE